MKTNIHQPEFINTIDAVKIRKNNIKLTRLSMVFLFMATLLCSCSKDEPIANETENTNETVAEIEESVLILDANFERALIDLGHDTNGLNGNILRIDAAAVTSLVLTDKNISSLEGIEGFTNLLYLYCDENNLSSLDISQNNLLIELDLSDNQVTDIDVSNNTQLEILNTSENSITSLDVSSTILLKSLNCNGNNLTLLDISNNTVLENLNSSHNQLTEIDVSNNADLIILSVNDNNLTQLNVSQNPKLIGLGGFNNQLRILNLKNGFNENLSGFLATNNPNLTCIEVDNPNLSAFIWQDLVDPQAHFLVDCNYTN